MTALNTAPRKNRTICIHFCQERYDGIVQDPVEFRQHLIQMNQLHPELFPDQICSGFEMKDIRQSTKLSITIRRITIASISYSIRPSFVMPYMTAKIENVEKALFLRKFAVPFWALSYCYGKYSMYWYRMEVSLGRNALVGTTVKSADLLPQNLCADEKHTHLLGQKAYIASTAAEGCILGAAVTESAGQKDLEQAYGVFKQEAQNVNPDYNPKTVNTDGWLSTIKAWKNLFPAITLIACFLHIYISIRDRSRKKFKEQFIQAAEKLWNCYKAENKASFSQRVRRLYQWAQKNSMPSVIVDKIGKLQNNIKAFSGAYDFPGAHRTSNMIDRLMQRMDRFLFSIQYFHGNLASANLSIRAWALIQNFAPSNPRTILKHGGLISPAERLNNFRYHDNWLENLLISASLGGNRSPPQKKG